LLSSGEFGCSEEILTIAAMLSIQSAWVFPKGTVQNESFSFSRTRENFSKTKVDFE
jgi:HrpA-like RNA helicase